MSTEDIDIALTQVRCLERENRQLRRALRDEYAQAALTGYLASFNPNEEPVEYASSIAADCFKMADAMMKARNS